MIENDNIIKSIDTFEVIDRIYIIDSINNLESPICE